MKTKTAALLLLVCSASLGSQSVSLVEQLRPFRINQLVVTDLQGLQEPRVEITGRTLHDQEIPLFLAAEQSFPAQLECFLYLDDSIQNVQIRISSSELKPVSFEYSTRLNPYQVTVFSEPRRMLPQLSGYRFTSEKQQLGPGDILILEDPPGPEPPDEGIRDLLDRGIHVITTEQLPEADRPSVERSGWQGELLLLDSLEPAVLTEMLESRREGFAAFKKRFYDLTAGAGFYGLPASQEDALVFEDTRVEDIAAALERQYLPNRLTGFHRMLLLAFTLTAVILVALTKKMATLLLSLTVVLCLFAALSFLSPDPDRSLHLLLNLHHLSSDRIELLRTASHGQEKTAPLTAVLPPKIDAQRFAPPDYETEKWSLSYGLIRSTSRELPLSVFTAAVSVKLDQLPQIEMVEGRYILRYDNPLRYWSLHEPD